MNDEASGATAIADAPPADDDATKSKEGEDLDYEIELNTPFGIVELEFEPRAKRDRKQRERKERAERKAAERAALKAKQRAEKEARAGRGGSILLMLLIVMLIAGAVALAIWLFARPGEDEEAVPDYLASPLEGTPVEPPKNAFERARARIRDAIHQGRKASRDAQREQEQRFREMTGR